MKTNEAKLDRLHSRLLAEYHSKDNEAKCSVHKDKKVRMGRPYSEGSRKGGKSWKHERSV